MSLLMDALKRAENSKQEAARIQFGNTQTPSIDEFTLEPISGESAKSTANPLPDLATYIDAVDADLANTAQPEPRQPQGNKPSPPPPALEQRDREIVRNSFAAKQAIEPPPSRLSLWLALGTLGIAGIAIGGYVWYQLNSMNQGVQSLPASTAAGLPGTSTTPPIQTPQANSQASAAPPSPSRMTIQDSPAVAETPLFPLRRETYAARPAHPDDEAAPPPIRLTRTQPELDTGLGQGHASLQRGELELARRNFEQVLQRDRNNTDALLALAAIAQRQNRLNDAEILRQRALVANPSDPNVLAAALNTHAASTDPDTTESRLKSLLSVQPESATLNFALGNLYSRQNRWPEAQQVYFNAVAAEADNPDYLFNLAVSLDHLRQSRLAAQHYRLALEASAKRPAAFDPEKIRLRLSELNADPKR